LADLRESMMLFIRVRPSCMHADGEGFLTVMPTVILPTVEVGASVTTTPAKRPASRD
jgi:hypothetical protein